MKRFLLLLLLFSHYSFANEVIIHATSAQSIAAARADATAAGSSGFGQQLASYPEIGAVWTGTAWNLNGINIGAYCRRGYGNSAANPHPYHCYTLAGVCPADTTDVNGVCESEGDQCEMAAGVNFTVSSNPNLEWDGIACCVNRNDSFYEATFEGGVTATFTKFNPDTGEAYINYYYVYTGETCSGGNAGLDGVGDVVDPNEMAYTGSLDITDVFESYDDSLAGSCPEGTVFGTVGVNGNTLSGCFGGNPESAGVDVCNDGVCSEYVSPEPPVPTDPNAPECKIDSDGDGIPDCYDPDVDGDGVLNAVDVDYQGPSEGVISDEFPTDPNPCDPSVQECGDDAPIALTGGFSCSAPPVWSGEDSERDEFIQTYLAWETRCDLLKVSESDLFEAMGGSPAGEALIDGGLPESEVDVSEYLPNLSDDGQTAACPANPTVTLQGATITIPMNVFCEYAASLRPIFLAFVAFMCSMMLIRELK